MQSVILKIGGSLLSPAPEILFDFGYAKQLKAMLEKLTDYQVVLAVGGGNINRTYQKLAATSGEEDAEDIHKIGVAVTNLNAEVLHGVFDELATPTVLRYEAYDEFLSGLRQLDFGTGKVQVVGSSRPGGSNDWNALQFALRLGQAKVIDVKNVDGVYTADPNETGDAEFIPELTWAKYLEIIGNPDTHQPGAHLPVDVNAAREAQAKGVAFHIVSGKDLDNVYRCITGGEWRGSVVVG